MYLCRISAGMAHFLIVIKEPCDNCFSCRCQNNLSSDKFLVSPCCKYFQLPQKVSSASCPNTPPSKKFSSASHLPRPILNIGFSCLAYVQQVYRIKCVPSYIIAITAAKCLTLLTAGLRCVYCTYIIATLAIKCLTQIGVCYMYICVPSYV